MLVEYLVGCWLIWRIELVLRLAVLTLADLMRGSKKKGLL